MAAGADKKRADKKRDDLLRTLCFVPCRDKAMLWNWIKVYLDWELPDSRVDPDSNCSPMDMVWEVYSKCLQNDDEDFSSVLYYAARDSFKTIALSIIEVLGLVHLDRPVAHMAAILSQSKKAQSYIKKHLSRPILRDYVVGDNARNLRFVRYEHKITGASITEDAYGKLSTDHEKNMYECHDTYIEIVICSLTGANSSHVPLFCGDETDTVTDVVAYEESKMIPAPLGDKMPITVYTSSRKFASGLVQREIDDAPRTGLKIRHWNLIDCTKACSTTRHLPELPKIPIYYSDDTLVSMGQQEYDRLAQVEKDKFKHKEGFDGCLSKCKIFAACQGRLATDQKDTSKVLKPVTHTQNQFKKLGVETALAQLLCRKPSSAGLIYARLEPTIHRKSAAEILRMITNEDDIPDDLTRVQLIERVKQIDECRFQSGLDYGSTHCFAGATLIKHGNRGFFIDAFAIAELDAAQQVDFMVQRVGDLDTDIFPDTAWPHMTKVMRKAGLKMRDWDKGKGTVIGGIDVMRMMISPAVGAPKLYFLADDEGVENLFITLKRYSWKLQADGRLSNVPNDVDDDLCDASRYVVMNAFAPKGGKVQFNADPVHVDAPSDPYSKIYNPSTWFRDVVEGMTNEPAEPDKTEDEPSLTPKGRFRFVV